MKQIVVLSQSAAENMRQPAPAFRRSLECRDSITAVSCEMFGKISALQNSNNDSGLFSGPWIVGYLDPIVAVQFRSAQHSEVV